MSALPQLSLTTAGTNETCERENEIVYNEFLDQAFTISLAKNVLDNLDRCYFRSEFIGFDKFPERNNPERPLIFASNHSGMAFPWDAIIFNAGLFRRFNYDFSRSVRAMAAPMLSSSILMNPFLIKNFWKRAGAVDATFVNFEKMMQRAQTDLLVYPEGVPGIGKGFKKKYRLQRFATSFVRMSLKYKSDIIPFATVNGEFINPYAYQSRLLNKIAKKIGIPFLPVGMIDLFLPLQPWMFYFGFPAKLTYIRGKRIKPYEMINKPYEEITQEEIAKLTRAVKRQMQRELHQAVRQYGTRPYQAKKFLANCVKNAKSFPFFLPWFWPSLFTEFDRIYSEGNPTELKFGLRSGIRAFFKNPMMFAFFLPIIGWIPILICGFRKNEATVTPRVKS